MARFTDGLMARIYSLLTNATYGLSAIETLVDGVETDTAAIKAKTDNLPSDPADASVIAGRFDTVDADLDTIIATLGNGGTIESLIDDLESRLTAARAGYLDNLSAGAVALQSYSQSIYDIVNHVTYGNQAIENLVDGIESELANGTYGLSAIETLVDGLESAVGANSDAATDPSAASGTVFAKLRGIGDNLDTLIAAVDAVDNFVDTEVASILGAIGLNSDAATDPSAASGSIYAKLRGIGVDLDTIAAYIDTEVGAIKAKTDNLPSDPADASDIASSFTTVNGKLDTIDDFLDTEIAAIKAKTDGLPATVLGGIVSMQRGIVQITSTNATNTATISAVDTSKSLLFFLGQNLGTNDDRPQARIELTNSTTITAYRTTPASGVTSDYGYQIVEFD